MRKRRWKPPRAAAWSGSSVNGQFMLASIKVDPSVIDPEEVEMLEDLVRAAINEGLRRAREMASEEMSKLTGGFKIPGLTP